MTREWKPGVWTSPLARAPHWHGVNGCSDVDARALVVLDPEDERTVDRVANAIRDHHRGDSGVNVGIDWCCVQNALRSLVGPEEPTDAKARVTDRRENVWRLLADGDWVCTSGPDCGEYLVWWQLAERGPLTVEGVTP